MTLIKNARVVTWDEPNESAVPKVTGFHAHVAEHEADEVESLDNSSKRVVNRLNERGILEEKTIVAHAIHVDAYEVELLVGTGKWVRHQPRLNMNNGVGVTELPSKSGGWGTRNRRHIKRE